MAEDRLFRSARQPGEFHGRIVAQGQRDKLVVPGERALDIEHPQLFFFSDADRGRSHRIEALQTGRGGRQVLNGVLVNAFFLFGEGKTFQPHARAFAWLDGFLLRHLAVAEEHQIKGGHLVAVHHFQLSGNVEFSIRRDDRRGIDVAQREGAHSEVAAETDSDKGDAALDQRGEAAGVVSVFIGRAVGEGDHRQRGSRAAGHRARNGAAQIGAFAVWLGLRQCVSVGRLSVLGEEQRLDIESGGFERRQQMFARESQRLLVSRAVIFLQ